MTGLLARPSVRIGRPVIVAIALAASATTGVMAGNGRAERPTSPSGAASPGWVRTFHDGFSGKAGSALSAARWRYDLGTSYLGGAPAWGTGEVETATDAPENVALDGRGHLSITALRSAAGQWTSGRVETARTDFAAPAGGELRMTARLRQPSATRATGYWPAFWALGAAARPVGATNWPSVGELDVMEDVNGLSMVSHTFHCGVWGQPPCNEPDGISSGLLACPGCQGGYHTYSVTLDRRRPDDEQLRFSTDGVVRYRVRQSHVGSSIWAAAVHHGFFLILDVAIGGSYPNKVCACDSLSTPPTSGAPMKVDYVSVFEKQAALPTTTAPGSTAPGSTAPASTAPATGPIQAEAYDATSGVPAGTVSTGDGGRAVGPVGDGGWLRFDDVDFGGQPLTQFHARVASGAAASVSGVVQVRLDEPGSMPIGGFEIANTGGSQVWRTVAANIVGVRGVHRVYVYFASQSGQPFVSMDHFDFST